MAITNGFQRKTYEPMKPRESHPPKDNCIKGKEEYPTIATTKKWISKHVLEAQGYFSSATKIWIPKKLANKPLQTQQELPRNQIQHQHTKLTYSTGTKKRRSNKNHNQP